MKTKGYKTDHSSWNELYDQLFVNEVEPHLTGALFVVDFPSRLSPLCKPKQNSPLFAERFEVYANGVELGNGNTEQTDVQTLRSIFADQHAKTGLPMDEEFLTSLRKIEDKHFAGVGIGIERLLMVLTGSRSSF
jgi:elongation factor P--beta-lysine ligase